MPSEPAFDMREVMDEMDRLRAELAAVQARALEPPAHGSEEWFRARLEVLAAAAELVETEDLPGPPSIARPLRRLEAALAAFRGARAPEPPRPAAIVIRPRVEHMPRIDAYELGQQAHDAWARHGEGELLFVGVWTWHCAARPEGGGA